MSSAPSPATGQANAPATAPPKTFWEGVITTTPVVLTILSTFLAGLSSSEMTKAQYDRSLAAQFQSKAADQWAFFQAKRIRNTIIEQDLDLFAGVPGRIEPDRLNDALEGLAEHLRGAASAAEQLQKAAGSANGLGSTDKPLKRTARRLVSATSGQAGDAAPVAVRSRPGGDEVREALAYLGGTDLPARDKAAPPTGQKNGAVAGDESSAKAGQADAVAEALRAIANREPESRIYELVSPIADGQIGEAVAAAELRAKAFEAASKKVDQALRDLDSSVRRQLSQARAFQQAATELERVMKNPEAQGAGEEVRSAAAAVAEANATMQADLDALRDYQAARKDYTARRQEREARYNQEVAGPYELRVYKSSWTSERHRNRSQRFFFGMLCAQGGATLASLALAARQKSTLWLLASAAGVAAILFSLYVYLFV